jgi:all-trans-retinol 13,14-reductase
MTNKPWERRDVLKTLLAGLPLLSMDWDSFPRGKGESKDKDEYDAIVIGAGLGGLSCAAGFARQGFRPLVLEQHTKAGGYATTFQRPGGFVFDVSLHSTSVGERDGLANLIPGFPEIKDVEFVLHPSLFRVVFPDYDIRVPQKNIQAYIDKLCGYFPKERDGIVGLFDDMRGISDDIGRISQAQGKTNMATFPKDFPYLMKSLNKTWGNLVDTRLKDPKAKAVVSWLWGYFGLPPSKLACYYYALPTYGYLTGGGYYPRGRSQAISNALVKFIEDRGGRVVLKTRVESILTKDHAAVGVRTRDGKVFSGRVVVSNANAYDTFHRMMPDEAEFLKEDLARMDKYKVSFSITQVFLGLNKDIVGRSGLTDSEISIETGYDPEQAFRNMSLGDVETCGFGLMLYDNVVRGYSPQGKNTLTITVGQSYDYWQKYEADYLRGNKDAYRRDKERMADVLVRRAEKAFLPGLSKAVEVREVGTPLTNLRYTSNYRGAVYGWDQTLDNSGPNRMPHKTRVKNLYLAGAWTNPGGGYGAVIPSGLECFAEIMKSW